MKCIHEHQHMLAVYQIEKAKIKMAEGASEDIAPYTVFSI